MLRTGLGLFKFTPRRDERPEIWPQRFGSMLSQANQVFGFEIGVSVGWRCLFVAISKALPRQSER